MIALIIDCHNIDDDISNVSLHHISGNALSVL